MHLYTILLTKATLVVQNAILTDKGVALHRERARGRYLWRHKHFGKTR